jgi:glycosyltransferase involved in cell wall biosynthesis
LFWSERSEIATSPETLTVTPPRRQKVGIVSTFDRLCGIASYAKVLVDQISDFCDVEVLRLDPDLLQDKTPRGIAAGDAHIHDLIRRFEDFDIINVHVEHGLYGATRKVIFQRLRWIFEAAPALCLTIHWLVPKPETSLRALINAGLKRDLARIGKLIDQPGNYALMGRKLYALVKAEQARKPVSIIVHTRRDRLRMIGEYGLERVYDHPLTYLAPEDVAAIHTRADRARFPLLRDLPKNTVIIGVFGFLSPYKGVEIAIRAIRHLPPEYHLAIFGGTHSNTGTSEGKLTPYAQLLRDEATASPDLKGRVHFCGSQDDQAFLSAMAISDCIVMPYLEVGLSSSGPISQAIELGARVVASRTRAFTGLADYYPDRIEFFEIGDERALAATILAPVPFKDEGPAERLARSQSIYRAALALL